MDPDSTSWRRLPCSPDALFFPLFSPPIPQAPWTPPRKAHFQPGRGCSGFLGGDGDRAAERNFPCSAARPLPCPATNLFASPFPLPLFPPTRLFSLFFPPCPGQVALDPCKNSKTGAKTLRKEPLWLQKAERGEMPLRVGAAAAGVQRDSAELSICFPHTPSFLTDD